MAELQNKSVSEFISRVHKWFKSHECSLNPESSPHPKSKAKALCRKKSRGKYSKPNSKVRKKLSFKSPNKAKKVNFNLQKAKLAETVTERQIRVGANSSIERGEPKNLGMKNVFSVPNQSLQVSLK